LSVVEELEATSREEVESARSQPAETICRQRVAMHATIESEGRKLITTISEGSAVRMTAA
jgi:hypothetical protein